MSIYIIDTETTGTVEPQPIQLAWLQLDPSWYRKVISKYSEHFLPSKPIEFGAMMVHNLTLEKLSNCAPHTEAKLPDDAEYIIGHNVDFDWIDAWMKAGAGKFMDAFSFHPYSEIDIFPQGVQLEKAMQGYAFKGPLVNSEKYFGANLFYDRQGYEETRRGYYLPHDGELKVAGWSIQHFVSSAAVGVPVCFFNPTGTISRRGPDREIFLYDFFAAYNAAIRLTVPAGRGERIPLGPTATALLFK